MTECHECGAQVGEFHYASCYDSGRIAPGVRYVGNFTQQVKIKGITVRELLSGKQPAAPWKGGEMRRMGTLGSEQWWHELHAKEWLHGAKKQMFPCLTCGKLPCTLIAHLAEQESEARLRGFGQALLTDAPSPLAIDPHQQIPGPPVSPSLAEQMERWQASSKEILAAFAESAAAHDAAGITPDLRTGIAVGAVIDWATGEARFTEADPLRGGPNRVLEQAMAADPELEQAVLADWAAAETPELVTEAELLLEFAGAIRTLLRIARRWWKEAPRG